VHEASHGLAARRFGDTTAEMLGRLTLNPLKHIDPVGTVLVPLIMLVLPGSFIFGWAKPVPVNTRNLRHPKSDMAWVAAAGPAANLTMAVGWALLVRLAFALGTGNPFAWPMLYMGVAGIFINSVLFLLNLLPLPPLDGGRVVMGLLPLKASEVFGRIEPYGIWILLALLFTHTLGRILWPLLSYQLTLLSAFAGMDAHDFERILRSLMGG
jgi:Zn-dependent protease